MTYGHHPSQRFATTIEAEATRQARQRSRASQKPDPLAERARIVAFWRRCAETNAAYKPYKGAWCRPFFTHPGLRRHLMPDVRLFLDGRDKAGRKAWYDELQAIAQRRREVVEASKRAAQPQGDLFTAEAA